MPKVDQVILRLRDATLDPRQLMAAIKLLEALVHNDEAEFRQLPESTQEILADLAYDLDYFEPNEEWRRESSSFYGPDRAVEEIRTSLARLDTQRAE